LWFALAILFLSVALVFVSVLVLLAFWDSNRLFAAGLLAFLYLGAGGACALVARARLRERPRLFSATVGELAKDLEHLDRGSGRAARCVRLGSVWRAASCARC